jgi:hypothetical protein
VARPGWLGLAQPIWAELGPAPKKYICRAGLAQPKKKLKKIKNKKNRKCRNKNFACLGKNIFLSIYSLISGSGIGKNIY